MSRKSKYSDSAKLSSQVWNAALYIRLSREDGDKEESDSIGTQRDFLSDFVSKMPEINVVDYFIDDGFTGTNFDRPGFNRMMTALKSKEINCVIVKDLSRFGRNYIEVGNYIEQIFPFMDVRFISVSDCLDSYQNPAQMNTVMVPFKNLMNDEYCRDISNKVRSSLNIKRKQGLFIGSFAPYGYLKNPENKSLLIVDESVSHVVRDIFRLFIEGSSILGIARKLNELGIPNPSAYKRLQGLNYKHPFLENSDSLWSDSSVRRILTNRIYIGDMVQGKNRIKSYKVQRSVSVPENEWFVVENTHEAIVDSETFAIAQDLLQRDTRVAPSKKKLYLFSGFIRCADCLKAMNRKTISQPYAEYNYYICSTYKKMSSAACSKHTIRSDHLEELVLTAIRKQVELAVSIDDLIANIESSSSSKQLMNSLDISISGHEQELRKIDSFKKSLYEDWKNDDITRDEYHSFKAQYDDNLVQIQTAIDRLKDEQQRLSQYGSSTNSFVSSFKKHENIECLTRELVVELIEMIYVHEGGNITIRFRFEDEFKKAVEFIENSRDIH